MSEIPNLAKCPHRVPAPLPVPQPHTNAEPFPPNQPIATRPQTESRSDPPRSRPLQEILAISPSPLRFLKPHHPPVPLYIPDARDLPVTSSVHPAPPSVAELIEQPSCPHPSPPAPARCPPHSYALTARPSPDRVEFPPPPTTPSDSRKFPSPLPRSIAGSSHLHAAQWLSLDSVPRSNRHLAYQVDPKTAEHKPKAIPHNVAAPPHRACEMPTTIFLPR